MENLNQIGDVAEAQYASTADKHLIDVTPNPRLLESLRDMGYDNYQALLDILDNSVDALKKCKQKKPFIKINTKFGSYKTGKITIIDNGIGMNKEMLTEALKLGSNTNKVRDGELGYFGVGLKSAAISIGRSFRIITKSADDKYITGIFDLDNAITEKSWSFVSVENSTTSEIAYFKEMVGKTSSGTILEISKLDRISNKNKTGFDTILLKNVAKTFRYYIDGNIKNIEIDFYLNNSKIIKIDPMGADLSDTKILNKGVTNQKYIFDVDGEIAEIIVRYYYVDPSITTIYPTEILNGVSNGFYVMRNHRQIMEADKLGFKGIDKYSSHQKNFRAELLFDGKYDEIFKTNVMKNRIILPQTLIDKMQKDLTEAIKFCIEEKGIRNPEDSQKVDEKVINDTKSIVKTKNEKPSTPTILTDKFGNPLKKEIFDDLKSNNDDDDEKTPRQRKEETEPRKKKTFNKIDVEYVNLGEDASFFTSHHQGNGMFLIRVNVDHLFYGQYKRFDKVGMEFMIDLLHSFSLASRQELYSDDLNQIDELIRTWSNFLRRNMNGSN